MKLSRVLLSLAVVLTIAACRSSEPVAPSAPPSAPRYDGGTTTPTDTTGTDPRTPFMGGSGG